MENQIYTVSFQFITLGIGLYSLLHKGEHYPHDTLHDQ